MEDPIPTRTCTKCGETKPLTEYHKRATQCKPCRLAHTAEYRERNREALRAKDREYQARTHSSRKATDVPYHLKRTCSSRINRALKRLGLQRAHTNLQLIGCSWEALQTHLEGQLQPGMTWDNHGEWHIDHIVPFCRVSTYKEFVSVCHYSNLQPLWAEDNLRKRYEDRSS